jgi:hypothetical protein
MAEEKLPAAQAEMARDFFCAELTAADTVLIGKPCVAHIEFISAMIAMKAGKGKDERVSLIVLMDAERSCSGSLEHWSRTRDVLRRDILRESMFDS